WFKSFRAFVVVLQGSDHRIGSEPRFLPKLVEREAKAQRFICIRAFLHIYHAIFIAGDTRRSLSAYGCVLPVIVGKATGKDAVGIKRIILEIGPDSGHVVVRTGWVGTRFFEIGRYIVEDLS